MNMTRRNFTATALALSGVAAFLSHMREPRPKILKIGTCERIDGGGWELRDWHFAPMTTTMYISSVAICGYTFEELRAISRRRY